MPRLDRFVDPLHRGMDYVKHRFEDAMPHDYPHQPASATSGFMSWLTGKPREETYAQKLGGKVADAFQRGRHAFDDGGDYHYGRHRGFMGAFEEEPGIFQRAIYFMEDNVLNSAQYLDSALQSASLHLIL